MAEEIVHLVFCGAVIVGCIWGDRVFDEGMPLEEIVDHIGWEIQIATPGVGTVLSNVVAGGVLAVRHFGVSISATV